MRKKKKPKDPVQQALAKRVVNLRRVLEEWDAERRKMAKIRKRRTRSTKA